MSHELIAHQGIGEEFSGTYYVESCYVKQTVSNKDYTDMVLRDRSGARPVKYWGTVKGLAKGCWAYVAARVEEYQGNPSIICTNIEIEDEPEDISEYMPVYKGLEELADDFDSLCDELLQTDRSHGDETCSMMVEEVYRGASFFEKFVKCPGSDGPSYGKQGGLIASVVRVARHLTDVSRFYGVSDYEKSVMLSAALLARAGAVDAYDFVDCMPVLTKRGLLIGVQNLTIARVSSALRRVVSAAKKEDKDINQETVMRVLHAITAAMASCEVKPMTKEAMILQKVMELDGEVVDAIDFIENDVNEGEEFTAYDPRLRRRYYRG